MTAPRYRLVSFDLDGTLVDTASEIAEAANRALAAVGLAPRSTEQVALRIGAGTRTLVLALLRDAGGAAATAHAEAALARFALEYAAIAGTACLAYPGAVAALDRLRSAGVRLACVTNKDAGYAERVLAACGLAAKFDLLVGGDTLPVRKPDAGVLGHVVAALGGAPATSAHVGDSRVDIEAARNAGVAAWAVPHGYNGGEPIASARPDRLFADLAAVAGFVVDGAASGVISMADPRRAGRAAR